jgi:hypothetical protein
VRIQAFTAASKNTVLWDIALCSMVEMDHWPNDGGNKYLWNVGQILLD